MLHQSVTSEFPTANRKRGARIAPSNLPHGYFGAILADPPWTFITYSPKGEGHSASQHYPVMRFDEIAAMPVGDLAADRCFLFLWVPCPHLPLGLQLIERWGFRYSGSAFCWAKLNPSGVGWHKGQGFSTRKNIELCLLARRGKRTQALIKSHAVHELIVTPRRQHSRKPDEQYERIEQLVAGPYLELFARQQWPGWTSWGNEVGLFKTDDEPGARGGRASGAIRSAFIARPGPSPLGRERRVARA